MDKPIQWSVLSGALLTTFGLSFQAACGDSSGTGGGAGSSTSGPVTTTTTSTGTDPCDGADTPPPAPPAEICARVIAGPGGARAVEIDLSALHANVRFFAPVSAYKDADQALSLALDPVDALTKPDLTPYAAALPGVVCALPASMDALGAASVEVSGGVAVVHPGTGAITLPAGVEAVAIDLRDLPEVPGLRAALEAAVAPALSTPIPRAKERMRQHHGMIDEVFSPTNVYGSKVVSHEQADIPAGGSADLPIALLTGPRMAPSAAEIAITLRLAGRAFIYGEDLLSGVAEMRWQGVGTTGVALRYRVLQRKSNLWPDVIPADRRSAQPECLLSDLAQAGAPAPSLASGVGRPTLKPMSPFGDKQPATVTLGAARAALVIAHGALRTFFPYFAVVGDTIDDRLKETLGSLGPSAPARGPLKDALRRFGNAISDGHQFVFDHAGPPPAGSFPVYIEDIDGEPVVRRSAAQGVAPGDTITSIGGVPTMQWYQQELARTSAASDGYRFNIATRGYQTLHEPLSLGLRDPDGNTKTIVFQPQPLADLPMLGFAPSVRPAGFLGDLGAPDLYYLNMSDGVLTQTSQLHDALTEGASAKGLVVDMRGYPGISHYEVAQRLIPASFKVPTFNVATLTGPDQKVIEDEGQYAIPPLSNPSFSGPIVLLVGHGSVSAAENFSLLLVDAQRVKVMGRRSAATNGNITGVQLPAAFAFSFTGMEVRHADAQMSQFHAIGIVPETESTLTAKALRDGKDPELEDAVAWLLSQ